MILQALAEYYHRKTTDPDPARRLAPPGTELKEIPFILELAGDGRLLAVKATYAIEGKRKVGQRYLVPQGVKRAAGIAANLLWDNAEYVLALPDAKKLDDAKAKGKSAEYFARLGEMQAAFIARIAALPAEAQADAGIRAVQAFLRSNPVEQVPAIDAGREIVVSNPIVTFRLAGDLDLVCQRPVIVAMSGSTETVDDGDAMSASSICLVTGERTVPARLHTAIKGVWGAQTAGANIVSFNLPAFNSHGKMQGANAPVGPAGAFAYTTALNHLLLKGSRQRTQVGDASTVFWAQKPEDAEVESWVAELLAGANETDDPDAHAEKIRTLYEAPHSGRFGGGRGKNRFYVLGLSPNAARLSVRFWHAATVEEIATRIRQWFDDLRIVRGPNDREHPPLKRLLAAVCLNGELDRLPPTLSGDIVRSILEGGPLPALWLNAAVMRCRAERKVGYLRACVIKACFVRLSRSAHRTSRQEITEMLDPANLSPGYRLGRLFAVLERAQEEASGGGLNTTIRERYYGAASSTPAAVFTTLMRLKNHHLAKLPNRGRAVNLEKTIADIVAGLDDFPAHLPLQEQGRFAIGYYHQRPELFRKQAEQVEEPAEIQGA